MTSCTFKIKVRCLIPMEPFTSKLFFCILSGFSRTMLPAIWENNLRDKYYKLDFYMKALILAGIIQMLLHIRSATVQPFIYFQF